MVEALVDLQTWVECLQINNTQVIPACDTLFKCGYTVVDAPRGRIKRLYTIDRINQTTGLEDPTQPLDWCSIAPYRQVDYSDLNQYVSQSLAGKVDGGFWGWCSGFFWGALAGAVAFPTCWEQKYRFYPPPTDAGLERAPPLPLGTHYQQTSTDAGHLDTTTNIFQGIRAQYGMWALVSGQIFVAPWIQSTETIVVEWDGIKRTWNDGDLVDDDPNLKKAVEWYVRWQQALKYDHDCDEASAAVAAYNEVRAVLIHECREENEVRDAGDAVNRVARGAALVVPTFVNEPQTATAQCPQNTTGNPVTYTVPQGTVTSTVSVAAANAQAKSLALQVAGQQLTCTPIAVTYHNAAVTKTVQCPQGSDGFSVSITIQAGQFTSTVSQLDADTQAGNAALAQATAALVCTFQNAAINMPVVCPPPSTGSCPTVIIPTGAYTSILSQADADSQAQAAATVQANAEIAAHCTGGAPTIYLNTAQSVPVRFTCATGHGTFSLGTSVTVPAGTFSSQISQADANSKAVAYANSKGLLQLQAECASIQAGGIPRPPIP